MKMHKIKIILLLKSLFKDIKLVFKLIEGRKQKKIQKQNFENEISHSQQKIITKSDNVGKSLFVFKEISIEKAYFSNTYNLVVESSISFYYPKIELKKYDNATIYSSSDFIITKDFALWDKYFTPQFAKLIPYDEDILKFENEILYLRKPLNNYHVENGFSLCGVNCKMWSHFIVQFLPKLYLLKQYLNSANQNLTIIIPTYNDLQIKELVYNILSHFNDIEILEIQNNQTVVCKTLLSINNTSYICDHSTYINPSDIIIPNLSLNILKEKFVSDVFTKYSILNLKQYRKIYISRKGCRNLTNGYEIEQYFVNLGFEIILPHELTLKEKIETFNQAEIIVGPFSSGFTNILFCQPKTKILTFTNFHRTFDSYISSFAKHFNLELLMLTGFDNDLSTLSDTKIPLENVKKAYAQFVE